MLAGLRRRRRRSLAYLGITDRAKSNAGGRDLDRRAGGPDRAGGPGRSAVRRDRTLMLPGNVNAFYTGSLLRTRQRLRHGLAQGYRRPRQEGRGAGDDLGARPRPAARARPRRSWSSCRPPSSRPRPTPTSARPPTSAPRGSSTQGWSSEEQGDTDRLTAASRDAALAVAKANVVAQQAAVNRLEELTGFEADQGAVRRRRHRAQRRYRRPRSTAGGTSGRALFQVVRHPPHAHLRERAAGVPGRDEARAQGDAASVPGSRRPSRRS